MNRTPSTLLALLLCGCLPELAPPPLVDNPGHDWDEDGYTEDDGDCDDQNNAIHPNRLERCDGIDNNCDGVIDGPLAVDRTTWYLDADGDGFGDPSTAVKSCDQPDGMVDIAGDCDDSDPQINPTTPWYADYDRDGHGVREVVVHQCRAPNFFVATADDCDDTNPDAKPGAVWYADGDGDGYGDPNNSLTQCQQPENYVSNSDDCDDTNPSARPHSLWFPDTDGDGYGAPHDEVVSCLPVPGHVTNSDDCDDSDPAVHPEQLWYRDDDSDGYGVTTDTLAQCRQPIGYVLQPGDCDDTQYDINPDTTWFIDADGDGYGSTSSTLVQCEQPSGYVLNADDCDDGDAVLYPDTLWYLDVDGDGYGLTSDSVQQCQPLAGRSPRPNDCDDSDATVFPDAPEVCEDGIDQDCDGVDQDCLLVGALSDARTQLTSTASSGFGAALLPHTNSALWVSAPAADANAGAVYLLELPHDPGTLAASAHTVFTLHGSPESAAGTALARRNAEELWLIAPGWQQSGTARGAVVLHSALTGTHANLEDSAALWAARSDGELDGATLLAAGDIDGDGTSDMVIGLPQIDAIALLFNEAGSGNATLDDVTLLSGPSSFGTSLALAGDLSGDGRADLFVGSPADSGGAGVVRLLTDLHTPTTIDEHTGWSMVGPPHARAGTSLASGDIDGDDALDLLIGAPGSGTTPGRLGWMSSELSLNTVASWADLDASLEASASVRAASALAILPDIDKDGADDVLLTSGDTTIDFVPGSTRVGTVALSAASYPLEASALSVEGAQFSSSDRTASGYRERVIGLPAEDTIYLLGGGVLAD